MHSFDASTMNFREVVQHTSPLNKRYWHFLIPLSGPASENSCEHEFLGTLANTITLKQVKLRFYKRHPL